MTLEELMKHLSRPILAATALLWLVGCQTAGSDTSGGLTAGTADAVLKHQTGMERSQMGAIYRGGGP